MKDLRSANIRRQREWDVDSKIDLSYRGNELAGETGEACNLIKKLERERLGLRGTRATKELLAEELADVVICADLTALHQGIDLDRAIRDKFNATSEKYGLTTTLVDNTALHLQRLKIDCLAACNRYAAGHFGDPEAKIAQQREREIAGLIREAFARFENDMEFTK